MTVSELDGISLFGGVGGIDLAGERVGIRTRLICEIDKQCRVVLGERFPDAVIHDDVRTLTANDLRSAGAVPRRTVVFAGFPCQDLSVAGRRRGMGEGTRSGLYWEVDRLLAEFAPAWIVLENVPGLLSATCACPGDGRCGSECTGETHQVPGGACDGQCIARHGGVMGAVLGSLAQRGYGFAYRVLDARHFGVPQRRRRVVIVGRLGDSGAAPVEVLLEPEGMRRHSSSRGEPRSSAAPSAQPSASRGSRAIGLAWQAGGDGTASGAFSEELSPTLQCNQTMAVAHPSAPHSAIGFHFGSHPGAEIEAATTLTTRNGDPGAVAYIEVQSLMAGGGDRGYRIGAEEAAGGQLVAYPLAVRGREGGAELEVGEPGDPMFALRAGNGGSSRSQLVAVHENQRGEITVSETAGTLKTGGGKPGQGYPAVTDGVIVRRLTPLECERLQGFPDTWTAVDGAADSQRYKEMGNSVAVPVFEWTLGNLVAVHRELVGAEVGA